MHTSSNVTTGIYMSCVYHVSICPKDIPMAYVLLQFHHHFWVSLTSV